MKKTHVFMLIIITVCGLLAVVFRGKERTREKITAEGSVRISTTDKSEAALPSIKKADADTPPTVVISNGVFVVDTREKLVYGTPAMEKYRAGDQRQAAINGAEAKVTLHVVDTEGKEVPDASVNLTFAFRQKNKPLTGLTDSNGLFVAQGTLTDDIIYRVTKAGYYETFDRFFLEKAATRCLENGRWIPWNPMVEVVLKEKRKPISMYVKKVEFKFPENVQKMGYDFLVGDWVAPHGKGITADMFYVYEAERTDRDNYDLKLTLAFPDTGNGCYMKKKEEFSTLVSKHEAYGDNYSSNMAFRIQRIDGRYVTEERITENDYLVFRTRGLFDEKGKIASAQYGKIYGPLGVPGSINRKFSFTYYFNPTPNDRNLEFDGKNNLFKPKWNEPDSAIVQP